MGNGSIKTFKVGLAKKNIYVAEALVEANTAESAAEKAVNLANKVVGSAIEWDLDGNEGAYIYAIREVRGR